MTLQSTEPPVGRSDGLPDGGRVPHESSRDHEPVSSDPASRGLPDPAVPARTELEALSTDAILEELKAREKAVSRLRGEQARLRARVAEIEREVAALAGGEDSEPPMARLPTPWKRDLNDLPLAEGIARLYALGDEFSPAEAEARLLEAGYSKRTANLRTAVTQVLAREGRFKRVSRGVYRRLG